MAYLMSGQGGRWLAQGVPGCPFLRLAYMSGMSTPAKLGWPEMGRISPSGY